MKDNLPTGEPNQTITLMEKIQEPARHGDEAWSLLEPVPVSRVFERIKRDLLVNGSPQVTTLQEIEEALTRIEVTAAAAVEATGVPSLSPQSPCWMAEHPLAANEADAPGGMDPILQPPEQDDVAAVTNTPPATSARPTQLALDSLFATLPMPVIPTPPPAKAVAVGRRVRLRKQYNTCTKRRSARIAKQPALPTMERLT
uniref:Uncharacterized protein n=1 Tax=Oryza punctata TaxID=4537 RepID=A0A0E0K329_ORYPU